jgi:cysteine desulfurase
LKYFDHNATAPMNQDAIKAWLDAVDRFSGNPSSLHRMGSRAEKALEDARHSMADLLACSPLDIVWTSGATESNNTIWHHLGKTLAPDAEVWISSIEHPCSVDSARHWLGKRVRWIPVARDGVIEWEWLKSRMGKRSPQLVCVMAANNETGCLQPWQAIRDLCADHGVPFFCDAAQWLGRLPADGLGSCDWVSGCAHKFGGPNGVGFLKCPSSGRLHALLKGGPQEAHRRAGTENVPGVLSMVSALLAREALLKPAAIKGKQAIQHTFETMLLEEMPGVRVLGSCVQRLWNTSTVVMPAMDCRIRWVVKLDKLGFAVSTGSACASGNEKPSHVLEAMALDPSEASRVLRFSSGWETPQDAWKELRLAVQKVPALVTGPFNA